MIQKSYYYGAYSRDTIRDCMDRDGFLRICEWVPQGLAMFKDVLEFGRELTDGEAQELNLKFICAV